MTAPHSARLVFEYSSPDAAALVARSVRVERDDIDGDRTSATVERDGATLRVVVDAADPTALRAGLNTWATFVEVAETVAGA